MFSTERRITKEAITVKHFNHKAKKTPISIHFVVFSHPQSSLFQILLSSCKQRHFVHDPYIKAQVKKGGETNIHS
ncbi:hypothetical protein L2E82_30046 [Cichorium intybus]|uniref:Uncharacterized protein n=1 Tax=Cichorium intybus TaxID=13427 RepID=A0ACB9CZF6_CICIN|nr:hypothetical protein L2E82_30046 [Cichorium intybus]